MAVVGTGGMFLALVLLTMLRRVSFFRTGEGKHAYGRPQRARSMDLNLRQRFIGLVPIARLFSGLGVYPPPPRPQPVVGHLPGDLRVVARMRKRGQE